MQIKDDFSYNQSVRLFLFNPYILDTEAELRGGPKPTNFSVDSVFILEN